MQTTTKEFTVELDPDRPGTLAKATDAIAKESINIFGFCTTGDGALRVVTSDPSRTRKAIESAGFKVKQERDVVVVDVEDRPGTAARLFKQIADAEVNLDIAYSLASNKIVVGSKDTAKLKDALNAATPAGART